MNVSVFKEFVRPLISSEENVTFASNLFSTPSELVIALAIIVSIVIVCALVFVEFSFHYFLLLNLILVPFFQGLMFKRERPMSN